MPAIERYDGVFFKVLRKALREGRCQPPVAILIISAKYGLITSKTLIPNYDKKMNSRAMTSVFRMVVAIRLALSLASGGNG